MSRETGKPPSRTYNAAVELPRGQPPRPSGEDRPRADSDGDARGGSPAGLPAFAELLDEVRREGRRHRRQALPLAGIGGTHVAGALADAATGAAGLVPLGAGAAAASGSYAYAHARAGRWGRLYAAVAATGSVGWQATALLASAGGWMPAALWAGGAALALPWWLRHSDPDPDITAERAVPPTLPPEPPADQPDPRVVTWGRHLAARGKPLQGSQLSGVAGFAYGWRGEVQLPVGHHWREVAGQTKAVTSIYDLPDGRVFCEEIPGASVRRARLTVLTVDPLEQTRRWSGPGLDPATGTFPLMTTADGASLPFRLWYPGGGACHALVAGATGSGKSACLDLIIAELAFSDYYIPWLVDGGQGASSPDWVDSPAVGHAATTPADARALLGHALAVTQARKRYLRQTKRRSLDPCPAMPGIGIVIDEAHNLLVGDENADIKRAVEILTQEGRKVGISVTLSTQVPSAAQLGGSTVIRNMLKSGTVVGLRTLERTAANMAGGDQPLPEPLHQLPAEFSDGSPTRGLGYMLTGRLIRSRVLFYDPAEWAGTPAPVVTLDEWTAAVEPPHLTGADGGDDRIETPRRVPAVTACPPGAQVVSTDAPQTVQTALDQGTSPDVAALMRATGLPMGAVRRALAQLN